MNLPHTRIIIVLGLANLGPLIYLTPFKEHTELYRADPLWFSAPGLVLIALWGAAYISAAPQWTRLPALLGVFALEKAFYAAHWMLWLGDNGERLEFLWARDPMSAFFLSGYGAWDGLCAIYFATLMLLARKLTTDDETAS